MGVDIKRRVCIGLALVLAPVLLVITSAQTVAATGKCLVFNFSQIFYADYKSGSHWDNSSGDREITWSAQSEQIDDEQVRRAFTATELGWIRSAIGSWDAALATVSFREVPADANPEVVIGFVDLIPSAVQPDAMGFWSAHVEKSVRTSASIKLKFGSVAWFAKKKHFIHTVQHEVGNVLGLGDISPTSKFNSVLEDPWQPPYGNKRLSNTDVALIRQQYGESHCA